MDWSPARLAREYQDLDGSRQAEIWNLLEKGETEDGIEQNTDDISVNMRGKLIRIDKNKAPGLCVLADIKRRRLWADSEYNWSLSYSLGKSFNTDSIIIALRPQQMQISLSGNMREGLTIDLKASMNDLTVMICYTIPGDGDFIDEQIILVNNSHQPLSVHDWNFGMARRLTYLWNNCLASDIKQLSASAVPWRRTISGIPSEIQDDHVSKLFQMSDSFNRASPSSFRLPSEAWAFNQDHAGLLVIKYSTKHIEYSVMRNQVRDLAPADSGISGEARHEHLLFGGSMRCHQDPSPFVLDTGDQIELGLTRYQFYTGRWDRGFELFQQFMDDHGKGIRAHYNPSLHWNELYDNKFFWAKERPDIARNLYFRLEDMEEEAKKARLYHCESLYLDPGWDTSFGSSIWDEKRLGSLTEFIIHMKNKYGLKVGLHIPLAGWCDPSSYPQSAMYMDAEGRVYNKHLCAGAKDYLSTKASRLCRLAEDDIDFLMFDGTMYTGPCCHPEHHHKMPYSRDEHVKAYTWLAEKVHEINPNVLIEMHDYIVGGVKWAYCPVYLGYGENTFDEYWGWELMWESMDDLLSGKALALYYYNLAYTIPIYLHINLTRENRNCLMFWWFASTCRHLGIGGSHADPQIALNLQKQTAVYRSLKPYFTTGFFHGIAENIHLHTLPGIPGGVLNVYNFSDKTMTIPIEIPVEKLQLKSGEEAAIANADLHWTGDKLVLSCSIGPMSPFIVHIQHKDQDVNPEVTTDFHRQVKRDAWRTNT